MSLLTTAEFEKALKTLGEALDFANQVQSDECKFKIARDACIQRFEYCIELSWKTSMKLLGSQTKFAKPAIREMARSDLIESAEIWLDFIEVRDNSSHSYDEDVAKKVFFQIQKFRGEANHLLDRLKSLS
ncbi:MAG: hypothetical protein CL676_08025 [Bdellovibrionaceae bacterium]|nr:hypothetical protein [Pseudobdellovibrionaceae bacterium]|tara:strand:+ start:138 stop:527 length:390 start_codon:yes stop_codon:yes gene_type:complete